jgi:hypothetical protein
MDLQMPVMNVKAALALEIQWNLRSQLLHYADDDRKM